MYRRLGLFLLLVGLGVGVAISSLPAAPETTPDLEQALKKARVDGKYRMLLAQIKVDKDKDTYSTFKDLGQRNLKEYAGYTDLPPKGHWVYVHPYWYIWRDLTSMNRPKRQWGPEQATGEPDTNMAGDIVTAWASRSQDDQDEWLLMEYEDLLEPTAVLVYETYNPGALVRVTALKLDGSEVELWKGTDPTTPDNQMGVSEVPVKVNFKTNRIKLYFASKDVPGWNEIDAVGIRDKSKKMFWAVAAEASTTYAPDYDAIQPAQDLPVPFIPAANLENRLKKIEDEMKMIRTLLESIEQKLSKKDKQDK